MFSKSVAGILFLCLFLVSFDIKNTRSVKLKRIVIDAGHGGKDPGCNGKTSREKDITLAIALQLGELLKTNLPDIEVTFTRKDDHFVELHDRASIANRIGADLFISIHVNAGPEQFLGTETYCMGLHKSESNMLVAQRENSSILMEANQQSNYDGFDPNKPESYIMFSLYQSANLTNSMILAGQIEEEFKTYNQRYSRGVKQAGFLVLWKTTMPAVLVETGFLTHADEEVYLNSEKGKMHTAYGIYSAIEDYKQMIEAE